MPMVSGQACSLLVVYMPPPLYLWFHRDLGRGGWIAAPRPTHPEVDGLTAGVAQSLFQPPDDVFANGAHRVLFSAVGR